MSNGEHEIRTPKGLRIGNRSVVDGKNMLQIKCSARTSTPSTTSGMISWCSKLSPIWKS